MVLVWRNPELIKSDTKDIYTVTKDWQINAVVFYFSTFYEK